MSGREDVDARLEAEMNALFEASAGEKWTDDERSAYCDTMGTHPLFWNKSPDAKDMEKHAAIAALANVDYDDEDTPEKLALVCKDKGNAAFAKGPAYYGNAIKHFNDAIDHAAKGVDDEDGMRRLRSICFANLAAIYLARKKYINVIDCCQQALTANRTNSKAIYRVIKAYIGLARPEIAIGFAKYGLDLEPTNTAFTDVMKEAEALQALQERRAEAKREEARQLVTKFDALRAAVRARHMQVGPSLYRGMRRTDAMPHVDERDVIHWPVLLLYPEYNQSDFMEEVVEVAPIRDILELVLPDTGAPPLWDRRGEYRASNVDVFFLSNPCAPIDVNSAWSEFTSSAVSLLHGTEAAASHADEEDPEVDWTRPTRLVRVPHHAPMLLALVHGTYVTANIPVFYIIARSSDRYKALLRATGGKIPEIVVPDLPPEPEDEE